MDNSKYLRYDITPWIILSIYDITPWIILSIYDITPWIIPSIYDMILLHGQL